MIKILLIVLVSEIFTAIGHILFKNTTNSLESYSLKGLDAQIRFIKEILTKPSIWIGLLSMTAGLIAWIVALSQGDLSLVFSIGSIQYILILILSHYLLGEKIDRMKFIGTFLVIFGIVLITIS